MIAPRFSVLLPTHDRADVIGFAIGSVLVQSERDFELLIVGDGCTDDTASVVASFDDERIRWFDLPKAPGFGYANRNVALREARGELVAFMAHDDLILPDHLATMAAAFDDEHVEWAYSRPLWVADDGTVVPFAVDLRRPDQLERFMAGHNVIAASSVVHRRTCLGRYGYWPEDKGDAGGGDLDVWRAIVGPSGGGNLAYVPTGTTLHFRAHWRGEDVFGPPPFKHWLRRARADAAWPTSLRPEVMAGQRPQEVFWRAMEADPPGWVAALRSGVAAAVDELAWGTGVALADLEPQLWRRIVAGARSGDAADVLSLARQSLRVMPGSALLQASLGVALAGAGQLPEGEAALRRAVDLDPGDVRPYAPLCDVLLDLGRPEDAVSVARAGIAVRSDVASLHVRLGQGLTALGDALAAEAAFRDALALDPANVVAAEGVAVLERGPARPARLGSWRRLSSWRQLPRRPWR